jgi:hypothetical protein
MVDADPNGNEEVVIRGRDFGPNQELLEFVSYGPSGTEYMAHGCKLLSHYEIGCRTSEGVGKDLRWMIRVDSQSSDLSEVTTNYAKPEIRNVTLNTGDTNGGSVHKMVGRNLATQVAGAFMEVLLDGVIFPVDGLNRMKLIAGSSMVSTRGENDVITFILPEMTKLDQSKMITVNVGHSTKANVEQASNGLTFVYSNPVIDTIENVEGEPAGVR